MDRTSFDPDRRRRWRPRRRSDRQTPYPGRGAATSTLSTGSAGRLALDPPEVRHGHALPRPEARPRQCRPSKGADSASFRRVQEARFILKHAPEAARAVLIGAKPLGYGAGLLRGAWAELAQPVAIRRTGHLLQDLVEVVLGCAALAYTRKVGRVPGGRVIDQGQGPV